MNIAEDWWHEFFKGPFGKLQLQGAGHKTTHSDVKRITDRVGEPPKRILDAPCGAGRHSLELARRGYSVLGIDFNPAVLAAAEATARAENLDAEFQLQDLRRLHADSEFDAVICLWSSIGYFSDADNERALLNLARAVKPGGHLILDLQVVESLCPTFSPRGWSWSGEGDDRVRVCEERTWNIETGRVDVTWTFIRDQQQDSCNSSIRIYTCRELLNILRQGGMSQFNCLGREGEQFQIGSLRLWLEAGKAG